MSKEDSTIEPTLGSNAEAIQILCNQIFIK
jgi:hypothetical protein